MSDCPAFSGNGTANISDAMRSIDCMSGQAVEIGFSRLFGSSGALSQALTILLTIYVALMAISLLSGRGNVRLNMLTPRMLQLGLVLTFATSWVAYQNVAWNLLVGAPDQVATILLGTRGSATQLFGQRLDVLFDIITNSAHLVAGANAQPVPAGQAVVTIAGNSPKSADLLWIASLLLMLGTVGVLIVARIALAAVMALGPVFIILSLFRGTRGLFEGWLRAAVMLALVPMFAVVLGGGTMALITPLINELVRSGSKVSLDLATSVFLAAFVYNALMILVMRFTAMMTSSLRIGGDAPQPVVIHQPAQQGYGAPLPPLTNYQSSEPPLLLPPPDTGDRTASIVRSVGQAELVVDAPDGNSVVAAMRDRRAAAMSDSVAVQTGLETGMRDPRVSPLGQRYRPTGAVA